jgi:type III secretory pathway component EscR
MSDPNQALEAYLDSVYIMSHSHSTMASYRLSVVNKNKTGFRDFLEQKYGIDELQLVEKIKNQKLYNKNENSAKGVGIS